MLNDYHTSSSFTATSQTTAICIVMIDFPTIELETCTNFDKGLVLFASFCAILVAIKQIKKYIDSKDKIAEKED